MKTLTEQYRGNIPVGVEYNLINVEYQAKEMNYYTTCENCGIVISNLYHITDDKNNSYIVGSECANALVKNAYLLSEAKRKLSRRARFYKMLKNQAKTILILIDEDEKNKTFWAYSEEVEKWNSHFIGRGLYNNWKKEIEFLKIPVKKFKD